MANLNGVETVPVGTQSSSDLAESMDAEGMDATLDDVERLIGRWFESSEHEAVREQLARLEEAPLVRGDAARLKVAALIVAKGNWEDLVAAVELGLVDWRDLLVGAFYADAMKD